MAKRIAWWLTFCILWGVFVGALGLSLLATCALGGVGGAAYAHFVPMWSRR